MSLILQLISVITALLFAYIFYLETIKTDSQKTADTFGMKVEDLKQKSLNNSFKNQGVYNLLIAVGLLYAAFVTSNQVEISRLIHFYILGVAAYGGLTVNPSILAKQGGLSILFLILSFIV
ncbi:DUF1304 domain-containing protein [Streptococcus pluranimalium]|uniref:DUF1304 domain-containing protein n=1 Tax=Streptococcus hyovaginalis TaxID=149015 RepID=UPI001478FF9D|nr:DUF1304 family protein [Streptococcus hyovaginalis]